MSLFRRRPMLWWRVALKHRDNEWCVDVLAANRSDAALAAKNKLVPDVLVEGVEPHPILSDGGDAAPEGSNPGVVEP